MKKSKTIIIAALISASLLSLIGCESQIDRELREMEEAHNAVSDLASNFVITLPEFGDTSDFEEVEPDEDYQVNTRYTLLPSEILLDPNVNLRKHIGNRYYVTAGTADGTGTTDPEGFYLFLYHEDLTEEVYESEGWGPFMSFTITGSQSQEGWSEVEIGESYIFYFEYLGYDESSEQHYGKYESHSPYDLW